jgi:hypothetical protein
MAGLVVLLRLCRALTITPVVRDLVSLGQIPEAAVRLWVAHGQAADGGRAGRRVGEPRRILTGGELLENFTPARVRRLPLLVRQSGYFEVGVVPARRDP